MISAAFIPLPDYLPQLRTIKSYPTANATFAALSIAATLAVHPRPGLNKCKRLFATVGRGVSNTAVAFHRKFLRPRAVRHDAGFEVEFKGMSKVRYSEPRRFVTFWAEPAVIEKGELKGRQGWLVAISQPSKWDDGTPFLETERDLIQERSKEALRFMGVPC